LAASVAAPIESANLFAHQCDGILNRLNELTPTASQSVTNSNRVSHVGKNAYWKTKWMKDHFNHVLSIFMNSGYSFI